MVDKTVLITGATGTIGKATAMELAKNNCQLILVGRSIEKLMKLRCHLTKMTGNATIDFFVADLSEPVLVRKAVEVIRQKYSALNALINVAAVFRPKRFENSAGIEYMFATNHLGPFVLTNALLDLLKEGRPSRVITVSAPSTTRINFDDINGKKRFSAGFMGAFGSTKMMNLVFTYTLARRLEGTGVTASAFHPGLVRSRLTKEMPALLNFVIKRLSSPPDKAATMLCRLAIDPGFLNLNGGFYNYKGKEIKSSPYSYNRDIQERLWAISEQLTK